MNCRTELPWCLGIASFFFTYILQFINFYFNDHQVQALELKLGFTRPGWYSKVCLLEWRSQWCSADQLSDITWAKTEEENTIQLVSTHRYVGAKFPTPWGRVIGGHGRSLIFGFHISRCHRRSGRSWSGMWAGKKLANIECGLYCTPCILTWDSVITTICMIVGHYYLATTS